MNRKRIRVGLVAALAGIGAAVVPMVLTNTANADVTAASTIFARGSVHTILSDPDGDIPCDYPVDTERKITAGVDLGTETTTEGRICSNNVDVTASITFTHDAGLGACADDPGGNKGVELTINVSLRPDHFRDTGSKGEQAGAAAGGISQPFCVKPGVVADFNDTAFSGGTSAEFTISFGLGRTD